jgi:nucleoside-diphosphate-sugar epimerase
VNIGSGVATSIGTLASKIVKMSGKNIRLEFDSSIPMGPISRTADITRVRETLEWKPKVNLEEGLQLTYEWVKRKLDC